MRRKIRAQELRIVCYDTDVHFDQPQLLHVVRRTSKGDSSASCGKCGSPRWRWPFNRWIFDRSPLVCPKCHGIVDDML